VTVTGAGIPASASASVAVVHLAARLVARPSYAPLRTPVVLDASGSKPPAAIRRFEFEFGDGTPGVTSRTATTTHTYARAGTYTARVFVTEAQGTRATASTQVVIVPATSVVVAEGVTANATSGVTPPVGVSEHVPAKDAGTATGSAHSRGRAKPAATSKPSPKTPTNSCLHPDGWGQQYTSCDKLGTAWFRGQGGTVSVAIGGSSGLQYVAPTTESPMTIDHDPTFREQDAFAAAGAAEGFISHVAALAGVDYRLYALNPFAVDCTKFGGSGNGVALGWVFGVPTGQIGTAGGFYWFYDGTFAGLTAFGPVDTPYPYPGNLFGTPSDPDGYAQQLCSELDDTEAIGATSPGDFLTADTYVGRWR
jgi:hypothetical protein